MCAGYLVVWRQMLPCALLVVSACQKQAGKEEGDGWYSMPGLPAKEQSCCHSNTQPGPNLNGLPACFGCGFCRPQCVSDKQPYYRLTASVLLSHGFSKSVDLKLQILYVACRSLNIPMQQFTIRFNSLLHQVSWTNNRLLIIYCRLISSMHKYTTGHCWFLLFQLEIIQMFSVL